MKKKKKREGTGTGILIKGRDAPELLVLCLWL